MTYTIEGTRIFVITFSNHPLLADLIIDERFEDIFKTYPDNCWKFEYPEETWEGIAFSKICNEHKTWIYFTAPAIRDADGKITQVVENSLDLMKFPAKDMAPFLRNPERMSINPDIIGKK
jgi:hypothetical protein